MKTILSLICFALAFFALILGADADTYVVTNNLSDGPGSLRDALHLAALTSPAPSLITFSLPGTPPYVIAPTGSLSALFGNVTVDGTTQPGYSNNTPVVIVDGVNTPGADCFEINGTNSLVRGLRIQNFGRAIYLYTLAVGGQSNRIEGCHIVSNGEGIIIYPSSNNVIGGFAVSNRNVISGNTNNGMLVEFTSGNLIAGNWIGVDPANSAIPMPNRFEGLWLSVCNSNLVVGTPGAQQIISGNGANGVRLDRCTNNIVIGNYIGCDASGSIAVSNARYGVEIENRSAFNTIGGTSAVSRNVISGNAWGGVDMTGAGTHDNVVLGNYIGVAAAGAPAIPNQNGVYIQSGAGNNTVGGLDVGAGNIIAGNEIDGIDIYGTNNVVQGNSIGISVGGTVVSNGNDGIDVGESVGTLIGGTNAGARNVICGNDNDGIKLFGNGATVQGNLIGIDANGFRKQNRQSGIHIIDGSGNLIGGTNPAARNVISANFLNGIWLDMNSFGNIVQGNYIGLNLTGTAGLSNGTSGIKITSSTNNLIGGSTVLTRNVISGNDNNGIAIEPRSPSNTIIGNVIGVAVDGITPIRGGLGSAGIVLNAPDNTVGGTEPGERNIISGNDSYGIYVFGCSNNVILGNYVGLASNGVTAVSNGFYGVYLDAGAVDNLVGGTSPGAGNAIASSYYGLYVRSAYSNSIQGNYIGLTAAGDNVITSTSYAVQMLDAPLNTFGGTAAGAGNVICGRQVAVTLQSSNTHHNVFQGNKINLDPSGNIVSTNVGSGFDLTEAPSNTIGGIGPATRNIMMANGNIVELIGSNTVGNVIQGNYMGVGPDGLLPRVLTNTAGNGVLIQFASHNLIGGTNVGSGNIIAYRTTGGISIFGASAVGNGILGNSIYSNGIFAPLDLAIDLDDDGPTGNDVAPDADTGANNLQNFPIITNAVSELGSTRIQGRLVSAPSKTYRVEFFANDEEFEEAKDFLGGTNVTTSSGGTGTFSAILSGYAAPLLKYITATATDSSNNTSELAFPLVRATSALDSDGDGMPDYWEVIYGLNPSNGADAHLDLDTDHYSNLDEYLADTKPNVSTSYLAIVDFAIGPTNTIEFPTSSFRNYNLESTARPTNNATWKAVVTNALGTGFDITLNDNAPPSTSVNYRIRVTFP